MKGQVSPQSSGVAPPRFPFLLMLLTLAGLTGSLVMREVWVRGGMSSLMFWTGVVVCGGVMGLAGVPFFARYNAWTQARKAAGTSAWWERLP